MGILKQARTWLLGGDGKTSPRDAHNTIFFYMELICLIWLAGLCVEDLGFSREFPMQQVVTLTSVIAGTGTLSSVRSNMNGNGHRNGNNGGNGTTNKR